MIRRSLAPFGLALLALAFSAAAARVETRVHGENSEFSHATVKLAWVVRKGASEDKTEVVIRLLNTAKAYRYVRLDGVDPFSKDRAVLVAARLLGAQADLAVPRAKFADHPSAEIHLFGTEDDLNGNRPALVVFYLGVPDTTPEFTDPAAAEAHLRRMLGSP